MGSAVSRWVIIVTVASGRGLELSCTWCCDLFTVTIPCLLRPVPGSDFQHQGEGTPTCGQELHPSSSHFYPGSATGTMTLILKFL